MDMMTMNLEDYKKIQETIDTVLIPIGMIEAHGPHCALGTDVLIPREFVRRLEPEVGDKVLMAPEVTYGHSWALAPFAGTIDISAETFSNYVLEIGQGFIKNGFKHIILFNGHGGNNASLTTVAEKLSDLGASVLTLNWFLDYRDQIKEIAPAPGHAGEDETSLVLAIDSTYAHTNVGHHEIPISRRLKLKDGGLKSYPEAYSGNAGEASVAKGEKLYEMMIPLVIKDIEMMWNVSETKGGN